MGILAIDFMAEAPFYKKAWEFAKNSTTVDRVENQNCFASVAPYHPMFYPGGDNELL